MLSWMITRRVACSRPLTFACLAPHLNLSRASASVHASFALPTVVSATTDKMQAQPRFRVVNPKPSSGDVLGNFKPGDLMTWGTVTAVSLPFGYLVGKPIRGPTVVLTGIIGGLGGFLMAYQNSYGRLTGHKES